MTHLPTSVASVTSPFQSSVRSSAPSDVPPPRLHGRIEGIARLLPGGLRQLRYARKELAFYLLFLQEQIKGIVIGTLVFLPPCAATLHCPRTPSGIAYRLTNDSCLLFV